VALICRASLAYFDIHSEKTETNIKAYFVNFEHDKPSKRDPIYLLSLK